MKVKGWKITFYSNGNEEAGLAIHISDKIDFKAKAITRKKNDEGINPTRRNKLCKYLCIGGPNYIKQILMDVKGEINSDTIIVGTLIPLGNEWIDLADQKIKKVISTLSDTLDQSDLSDIF